MKNLATYFTNLSSDKSLRNPFEAVKPEHYSDLPTYLKSLSTELLRYNPSIMSTFYVEIVKDHTLITVEMYDA